MVLDIALLRERGTAAYIYYLLYIFGSSRDSVWIVRDIYKNLPPNKMKSTIYMIFFLNLPSVCLLLRGPVVWFALRPGCAGVLPIASGIFEGASKRLWPGCVVYPLPFGADDVKAGLN